MAGSAARLLAAFFLFALSAVASSAQATARQGGTDAPQADQTEFHSPMLIELPFHALDPSTWNGQYARGSDGIARFVCDGVSFKDFAVSVARKRGKLKVRYRFVLANVPSVDKVATVRIDLLREEEMIEQALLPGVLVEEGKISVR